MNRKNGKIMFLVLAAMLVMLFAGCAKKEAKSEAPTNTPPAVPTVASSDGDAEKEPMPEPTTPPVQPAEKIDINIAALKGPTALGMLKLMEDAEAGTTANRYHFTVAGAADELTAGIIKGDYPIAAIPCNLASVLYNKSNGGVTLLGINTLGVLYIVETGDSIKSVTDLKGKKIYSTGKGTTPEYTLVQLLKAAGLDPEKDVTIEFKSEATEVAAILSEADNAVAMLPQPYVTTVLQNNERVRIALDVTKEWEALSPGTTVVTGVVVANTKFLNENKDAVLAFLDEYKVSAAYTVEQVDAAAQLAEKFDIFKAPIAKKAIPYCNIVLIDGAEMKTKAEAYLKVLYEQNPAAVGGQMPADGFFFRR